MCFLSLFKKTSLECSDVKSTNPLENTLSSLNLSRDSKNNSITSSIDVKSKSSLSNISLSSLDANPFLKPFELIGYFVVPLSFRLSSKANCGVYFKKSDNSMSYQKDKFLNPTFGADRIKLLIFSSSNFCLNNGSNGGILSCFMA